MYFACSCYTAHKDLGCILCALATPPAGIQGFGAYVLRSCYTACEDFACILCLLALSTAGI